MSQGDLLGAIGPCRARLWGVCNTPLHLRSIVFIRMGRGVLHTPHQTSLERGRRWGWGLDVSSVFGTAEGAEGA